MKLLLAFLLTINLFAAAFILQSEQVSDKGSTYWLLTICKDNYQYTIAKPEPFDITLLEHEVEFINYTSAIPCQLDFKDPSQFPKD